jgi:hypothetical protein
MGPEHARSRDLGKNKRPFVEMAEREGFEPFCRLEAKSLENADLIED